MKSQPVFCAVVKALEHSPLAQGAVLKGVGANVTNVMICLILL